MNTVTAARFGACVAAVLTAAVVVGLLAADRAAAEGTRRALLVGVGAYDHPSIPDLSGPPRDVGLLAQVLADRGFAAGNVAVLTDDADTLPTRDAILEALDRLAERSRDDDFVFIMLGGHGSRQPDADGETTELDGRDEIFLPADAGEWDASGGSVTNAIVDDELAERLAAIQATGAFVWLVVDSCHSETTARGIEAARQVAPAVLGVPEVASRGVAGDDADDSGLDPIASGRLVAFYAAQADQLTYDKLLPAEGEDRTVHGIFSFHVAQVLATAPTATFNQAIDDIHLAYRALNHHRSTPIVEGLPAALDRSIGGARDTAAPDQHGFVTEDGVVVLDAGRLHRLTEGSILALADRAAAGVDEVLAYARAEDVDLLRSVLLPITHAGVTPPADLPTAGVARVVDRPLDLSLTIAPPEPWPALEDNRPVLAHALRWAAGDDDLITWVGVDSVANVRLDVGDERLWFLPSSGERVVALSLPLPPLGRGGAAWVERFRELAERHATTARLLSLARELASDPLARDVDVRFSVNDAAASRAAVVEVGDRVALGLTNNGNRPIDVTVLFVDAERCVHPWFPPPGTSNRLPPGETLAGIEGRINATTVGREGWVVLGVATEPNRRRADFTFLAGNCDGARALGGAADATSGLQAMLLAAAGEDASEARGLSPWTSSRGGLGRVVEWEVRR